MILFRYSNEELISLLHPTYRLSFVKHVPAIKVAGRRVLAAMCLLNLLGTALALVLAADEGGLEAAGLDILLAALYLAIMNGNVGLLVLRTRQIPLHMRIQVLPIPRLILLYQATVPAAFMAGAVTLIFAADGLVWQLLAAAPALLIATITVLTVKNHRRAYQGGR